MISGARRRGRRSPLPTIVFVHSAFTGTSSWFAVTDAVLDLACDLIAVANPLRSLASDAAYVAALAAAVDGPVLLVGHGYGGAVITVAGATAPNVIGLVYVAGAAPNESECYVDLLAANPDRRFLESLRPVRITTSEQPIVEITVVREAFAGVLSGDRPASASTVASVCQRPVTSMALEERPAHVGWRGLPCWAVIPTADLVLDVETQRAMAMRSGAVTMEIDAAHLVTQSQPWAVAALVRQAALHGATTR